MNDWQRDEWHAAVADLSEMARTATEMDVRRADGLSGDAADDYYPGGFVDE